MADRMMEFKIKGRKMNIPNEGLSPLDLGVIVDQLEKDMNDLESKSGVIDVSKQAIITAIHYATELFKLKNNVTTDNAEKKSQ